MSSVLALLLPPLLHVVHADIVVLVLAWLGIGATLRAGRTLLDRLVLAALVLTGAILTAGLVFSLWRWHLAPVPLGITLLLGTAIAMAAGRRPSIPVRVEASDAVIVGSSALAFWIVTRPIAGLDQLHRLRFSAVVLDRMSHYALFESIQRLGGFDFEHQAAARLAVQTPTEVVYPQGSHFLLAVANNFLSSSTSSPTGPALLNRYFLLVLAVYSLCVGAVAWSARWIAGPAASATGRFMVSLLAASCILFGPTAALLNGADAQLTGMTLVVLAAALIVRPVESYPEQVLLASAATIAVFYSYNIYGPIAALGFVLAGILFGLPLLRRWRVTFGIGVPAAAVALLPSYLTATGSLDVQKQALVAGGHIPMSGLLAPLIGAVAISPILSARVRRDPIWRGVAALLGVIVIVLGLFALYGSAHAGGSYYFGKLVGAAYLCMVGLLGLLGHVLFRARSTDDSSGGSVGVPAVAGVSRMPGRAAMATVASAAVIAALLVLSGFQQRLPGTTNGSKPVTSVPLAFWSSGRATNPNWSLYAHLADKGELPASVPTIIVAGGSPGQAWGNTFYVSALSGNLGSMQHALAFLGGQTHLSATQNAFAVGRFGSIVALVRAAAQACPRPPRIIVSDPTLSAELRMALQKSPVVQASVVTDRGLKRS